MVPDRLAAALLRLQLDRPYVATAIQSLFPIARPGLGTMAVDRWGRLYFDPAILERWSTRQVEAVLYHEIWHLLRAHPERFEKREKVISQLATDAEINDDVKDESLPLPGDPILPEKFGLPRGCLAEEYYEALIDRCHKEQETAPQGGEGAEGGAKSRGGVASNSSAPSLSQSGAGDAGGTEPCDAADDSAAASSGFPPASLQGHAGPVGERRAGEEPEGADEGNTAGQSLSSSGDGQGGGDKQDWETPAPGGGKCGSCATGHPEPWELPPDAPGVPALSPTDLEMIRVEVAMRILEASKTRGDIPLGAKRWAASIVRPKIDWRRELRAAIKSSTRLAAGQQDYSYHKPSRRASPDHRVLLPAAIRPTPRVAVIVDTSGSVSDHMLGMSLGAIKDILRQVEQEGVAVICCDAAVQSVKRVFDVSQVELVGGGGTDMRVGLEEVSHLRPRPELVIVVTDGLTPWPENPPMGMRAVVVLLGEEGTGPRWGKTIRVEEDEP